MQDITLYAYQSTFKKNGFYRCKPCGTRAYWSDPSHCQSRGIAIRQSTCYQAAIQKRDGAGVNNGMYGRRHSEESRRLMSESRTGKTGSNATAWRGGKTSFTKRVKRLLTTRVGWYAAVFARDNSTCKKCGSVSRLDAHHIEPVVAILKRITQGIEFSSEEEKLEFVISHPDIVDPMLLNGITLCRSCHRKVHTNWGSHDRP